MCIYLYLIHTHIHIHIHVIDLNVYGIYTCMTRCQSSGMYLCQHVLKVLSRDRDKEIDIEIEIGIEIDK